MNNVRILIAGARIWTDVDTIRMALAQAGIAILKKDPEATITLVSGGCPRGADAIAEQVAKAYEWDIELHPADWGTHGKKAGFLRNQEMADAGADLCLAFVTGEARGTRMMVRCAEKAGIPVTTYTGVL